MMNKMEFILITGASSGIGLNIAVEFARHGENLILVARRLERLNKLKKFLENNYKIKVLAYQCDLALADNIYKLHSEVCSYSIKHLINCAGFGAIGDFNDISDKKDIDMINVNILSYQLMMKLFSKSMKDGIILNICSAAAFSPDPLMATYGATKAYVLSYSKAVNYELKRKGSRLRICTVCPGPVKTEFFDVANSNYSIKPMSAKKLAKISVNAVYKGKTTVLPLPSIHFLEIASKIVPPSLMMKATYEIQKVKIKK